MSNHDEKGRFTTGNSANPGGRPRKLINWAREVAAKALKEGKGRESAFDIMADIMHGEYEATPSDRISAFRELANRALGKPMTYIELTGADEEPINKVDMSKLTDKELATLYKLMKKTGK